MIILIILLFILCGMISSKIKLFLDDVEINNIAQDNSLVKRLDGKLNIYWFGLVKIISLRFDKSILTKYTLEDFINNKANEKIVKAFQISDFKILDIKLEKLSFISKIGTEDVRITSFVVFALSSFLTFLVSKNIKKNTVKNYKYKLTPIYLNKNVFSFKLNCIISVKTVNIIYMLFRMMKRSVGNNGRASNRKLNDYSYE